ncbi:hypothetical protein BN77_3778 [Rhizobium mesoamericanum STM3625]|uniref:Uncharacterized protein n=1 Tax=Rhizobium mesoamericanum STM3625 TaxID=1211777 RepID=K0PZ61_9HYPH|nr:hypothetical protein BN77_3778 [Rhizobium mesoamericanum STM3625]
MLVHRTSGLERPREALPPWFEGGVRSDGHQRAGLRSRADPFAYNVVQRSVPAHDRNDHREAANQLRRSAAAHQATCARGGDLPVSAPRRFGGGEALRRGLVQHNPNIPQGRDALKAIVQSPPQDVFYEPGLIVAEGDFVAIHGRIRVWQKDPRSWLISSGSKRASAPGGTAGRSGVSMFDPEEASPNAHNASMYLSSALFDIAPSTPLPTTWRLPESRYYGISSDFRGRGLGGETSSSNTSNMSFVNSDTVPKSLIGNEILIT